MMTNFSEYDLTIPSLKIIANVKDGIDTQKLIESLRLTLKPNGEDTLILVNRSDDKFSQKVRNLKSHKSLERLDWVKFKDNKYYITDNGISYLNQKKNYLNLEKKEVIFNFIPLKYFNFNERLNSFFKLAKCKFVHDLNILTSYGENIDKLKSYRNMGMNSINALKKFYSKYSDCLGKKNFEIEYDELIFLYNKNKEKIERFIIENVENEPDTKQRIILDLELFNNFLTNNFKNPTTYKMIFEERILNNNTLDLVGKKLNLTRERIRQIEKVIKDKLNLNLTIKKSLYQIDTLIKKIVFESSEDFYNKLILKKIIKNDLSFKAIFNLLNLFSFKKIKKFKKINKNYFAFESAFYEKELIKNINNFAKKSAKDNGIVNLNILLKNLKNKNFSITKNNLLEIIDEKILKKSLNIHNDYLLTNVLKKIKKSNNILVGVIKSTLSVTNKIDIDELITCIKQFRRINNYSPEPKILIEICKYLNYEIQNNFIINKNYSANNSYLTGVRKNLFRMFLDNERIMTAEEILENYEKYNLNINSVNVMIYENLFTLPRKGVYVLAGTEVDDYILDRLEENRKKALKKISDNSNWSYNKSLNIVFSCDKISLQKGIIYIPANYSHYLPEGEYVIEKLNEKPKVKVFASQLWLDGPSKIYFKKKITTKAVLEFDAINKVIILKNDD